MAERITLRLFNAQQGYQAIGQMWQTAKSWLVAGHRLVVELRPATRSTEQNAKLHAMLTDIAKQVEWAGAKRDVTTWKRLATAAWLRARGEPLEVLPAIDGCGVDIVFERTSRLSVGECSELIDFVYAWGTEHDVIWREARQWSVDPETGEIFG